jgi:hypothetical protein
MWGFKNISINFNINAINENSMTHGLIGTLIETLKVHINFKRVNSPSTKSGNTCIGGTVGTQVTIQHHGLTYTEIKDLVELLVNQKLVSFEDDARRTYTLRVEEFKNDLLEKIKNLPSNEIEKLKEPDTQLILREAASISGRKQDPNLKKILSNLVIHRIKNDKEGKEELKNIVFNEAILTINKLTMDQIKIITLCYITQYVAASSIDSQEKFVELIDNTYGPFLDFKNTSTEFQHIVYTGCGSMGVKLVYGSCVIIPTFGQRYPAVFTNSIKKDLIDTLNLSEDFKNKIVKLNDSGTDYQAIFNTPEEFQNFLKEYNICDDTKARLSNLFYQHQKTNEEIINIFKNFTKHGKKMIEIWTDTPITTLSLTSVGIAIGACYFQQVTSQNIDIDIWLN